MTLDEMKDQDRKLSELRGISRKLRRIFERQCNGYNFYPDGPYSRDEDASRAATRDERREEKLKAKAGEIATGLGVKLYVQGDPRGCALYLVPASLTDEEIDSNYSSYFAIY